MGILLVNGEKTKLEMIMKNGVCPKCGKSLEEEWIYNAGDWCKTEAIYSATCCGLFFELFATDVLINVTPTSKKSDDINS